MSPELSEAERLADQRLSLVAGSTFVWPRGARERWIAQRRDEGYSFETIALVLTISRQRVQQLDASYRAFERLREIAEQDEQA